MATKPLTSALANQPATAALIEVEIAKLFIDVLHVNVQSPTTNLLDTGILDSQAFVQLLLSLEQKFDVLIGFENLEIENFSCLEKITTLVCRRIAEMSIGK